MFPFHNSRQVLAVAVTVAATLAAPAAIAASQTIIIARDANGALVLSDKVQPGTSQVERRTFELPANRPSNVLEAERNQWRAESEAFARRQAVRDSIEARRAAARVERPVPVETPEAGLYLPAQVYGPARMPNGAGSQSAWDYSKGVGAVDRANPGFQGSGFSVAR